MQWFHLSSYWGYLVILSSHCQWPTDRPTEWLAGCEETKVCPFLIIFPLCIICRYLLDSQDQHVSLGGSALYRNLVNMDGILKDNRRNLLFEYFMEGASRSDVPISVVHTTYRGRESPGRGHKQRFQKRLLMFKKINIFYGVQFAVSLVFLNDCRSQNSERIKKSVPYSSTRGLFSLRRSPSIEMRSSFSNLLWIKTGSYSFTQGKISTSLSIPIRNLTCV